MTLQIFVDSRDRSQGTPGSFTLQLPTTLVLEGKHRGRIDNLRIPVCIPTIQSGVNDTLQILKGGQTYNLVLPQGNMDGVTLAGVLQSLLGNIPGTWAVTYDTSNISMQMVCDGAFQITGGAFGQQLLSRSYTQTPNGYNFLYCPTQGLDVAYLCCSTLSSSKYSCGTQGSHDTLMSIVFDQPFGSVMNVSMSSVVFFDIPAVSTQTLQFELRDRSYRVLNIVPNISFTLTIDTNF